MRPIPRSLPFLLGFVVFLAMAYLDGRATFLENDMALPPIPGAWKLSFAFDPLSIAGILIVAVLATIPTLIVRRCAIGSWVILGISILASMPIFFMVVEWAGIAISSNSDFGYLDAFVFMSALLYGAAAIIAAIWAAAA